MVKSKRVGAGWKVFGVVAILLVAVFVVIAVLPEAQLDENGVPLIEDGQIICPTDLDWSGSMSVQNMLNVTGAETYDTTMNLYTVNGDGSLNFESQITDTTTGSMILTCGQPYAAKILSVNDADSSRIRGILSRTGVTAYSVSSDGVLFFTPIGSRGALTVSGEEHTGLEVRAYNVLEQGLMWESTAAGRSSYHSIDGVIFTNATEAENTTIGSGGEFHVQLFVRTNTSDRDYNDQGVYFLIDAPSGTWNVPTVKFDGITATEASASMTADEKLAYTDYEYAYLIDKDRHMLLNDVLEIDFNVFALSGQNPVPSTQISTDFAAIGTYASSLNANDYKIGSVDDSSSRTAVYNLFDVVWQMD